MGSFTKVVVAMVSSTVGKISDMSVNGETAATLVDESIPKEASVVADSSVVNAIGGDQVVGRTVVALSRLVSTRLAGCCFCVVGVVSVAGDELSIFNDVDEVPKVSPVGHTGAEEDTSPIRTAG